MTDDQLEHAVSCWILWTDQCNVCPGFEVAYNQVLANPPGDLVPVLTAHVKDCETCLATLVVRRLEGYSIG